LRTLGQPQGFNAYAFKSFYDDDHQDAEEDLFAAHQSPTRSPSRISCAPSGNCRASMPTPSNPFTMTTTRTEKKPLGRS
jgi:hypothetical protein